MKENPFDNKKKLFIILLTGICFVAVITAMKRIFFGLDNDEQYAVALIYRVARGDILIKEMWEPHQFSVLFLALPLNLFLSITKSTDYLLVFLRIIGVFIQVFTSFLMYRFLRKKCDSLTSLLSASFIFFYLPKFIQSPEFANMQIWLLIILLISFLYIREKETKAWYFIIPGLLFLLEVLDYPSCFLLFLMFAALLWNGDKKRILAFLIPTIAFSLGFGLYIFLFVGYRDFPMYLSKILSDGSHDGGTIEKSMMYLSELPTMLLYMAIYLILAFVITLPTFLITKRRVVSKHFFTVLASITTSISFVDQIRFWVIERTPLAFPQYRFVALFLLGILVFCLADDSFKAKWKSSFGLFYIGNSISFFMIMLLTNLPLKTIFGYLLPACILSLAITLDWFSSEDDNTVKQSKAPTVALTICVLGVSVFSQLWLVSINNEGNYEDIRLVRQKSLNGASKYVYREWLDGYRANSDYDLINATIPSGSRIFLYGRSSLTYLSGDYEICTPSTISTPSFDKNIEEYFSINPQKMPQYIIHEKWVDGRIKNVSEDYMKWYNNVISEKVAESEYIEIFRVDN